MVMLNRQGHPTQLYYITNVLYQETMESDYGFYCCQILRVLPSVAVTKSRPFDKLIVAGQINYTNFHRYSCT